MHKRASLFCSKSIHNPIPLLHKPITRENCTCFLVAPWSKMTTKLYSVLYRWITGISLGVCSILCKNIITCLLQRLILLSAEVRRGWRGRSGSSRLWWRSCKGICESRWRWILDETSNASCCRLSIWRKKEIMFLVFVCTPNLEHRMENDYKTRLKNMDGINAKYMQQNA